MLAESSEKQLENSLKSLCSVSIGLMVRRYCDSDLGDARISFKHVNATVTYETIVTSECDSDLIPTRRVEFPCRHFADERLYFFQRLRLPELELQNFRMGAICEHVFRIGRQQGANQQSISQNFLEHLLASLFGLEFRVDFLVIQYY